MIRRVVVVDDDEINRRGMAGLLGDRPEIELVGSLSHEEAMAWDAQWDSVDIALVDAADIRRPNDHFPGVAVVDHIRRRRSSEQTVVVVVTGHFFDDAVRRRMREANADYFFHRGDLQSAEALYSAVLHPELSQPGVPGELDPEAAFRLGIVDGTRVNQALEYSESTEMMEKLDGRGADRSRSWNRMRGSFNDVARLTPVNADGRPPERHQAAPSLTQIERFVRWATRVK